MTILVPIMMFGWPVFAIILFSLLQPRHAVLISLIGAWLFLPMATYDLPGIPAYSKTVAASLGVIVGILLFDSRHLVRFRPKLYDIPMLIWCLCPIATSISNDLGFYDGLSSTFSHVLVWGIPYLAGQLYFYNQEALNDLAIAIIIGGLLYVPLCFYEIRMSPQLSNIFYGFFPHSWAQHFRDGGYRPIVFMQHGLMVSLWMAISTVVAFWLWRSRQLVILYGIPMGVVVGTLAITTILCKSVNGWFALLVGCCSYYLYSTLNTIKPFRLLIGLIIIYILIRSTALWDAQILPDLISRFVNTERAGSLAFRLTQEDLFSNWTMNRPWFGWGGYGRNRPLDIYTGRVLFQIIDSMWLNAFSTFGYTGLGSLFGAMLIGPWLALKVYSQQIDYRINNQGIILSMVVILFMIDGLFNGMRNPVYMMASGGLLASVIRTSKISQANAEIMNVNPTTVH